EAMATGLPVLVTSQGAALDFCSEDTAYLLPARLVRLPEKRLGELETVDFPFFWEPEHDALCQRLRHVFEHRDAAGTKGVKAGGHIRQHLTWEQAAAVVEERLLALRGQPVRRLSAPQVVPRVMVGGPPDARPRVSLCMIVKNEEANLPDCLGS